MSGNDGPHTGLNDGNDTLLAVTKKFIVIDGNIQEIPSADAQALTSNDSTTSEKKSSTEESSDGLLSEKMTRADWKALPPRFIMVYTIIFCMWLGLLSVYWGSLYKRQDRVKNMKILVAIEDAPFQLSNQSTAAPVIGPMFEELLQANVNLGDFVFANITQLSESSNVNNTATIRLLESQVHTQKYWAALHVSAEASALVYELILSGNTLSPIASQVEQAITAVYESGRHFSALSQYVTKNIYSMQLDWSNNFAPLAYENMINSYLTSEEILRVVNSANPQTGAAFSYFPLFRMVDLRPPKSSAVLGPSELGLIYAQIFSFHQFNFSADLHNSMGEFLRIRHLIWYRILFSQLNHIMLALVYGLMTIAFQVPTNIAFGNSGFLVLWATMYMFISASGGLNECVGTLISFYDKKGFIPPWIILNIVLNISPTFAPFELLPGFYRFGYAMPMVNTYEALKVVFFDTWKGTLGRNYGILAAWMVLTNIGLAIILVFLSKRERKAPAIKL